MMRELRVLGIQRRSTSPEAAVFSTLLLAMQQEEMIQPRCVFRVVQFGDEAVLEHGEKMRFIPGVQVLSVHLGGALGSPGPRRKKLLVFGRLLLSLPGMVASSFAFRPDVIYTSQQRWDVRIGTLLSILLRRPHVIHLHYMPGSWLGKEAFWRLKHCASVIGVSEFIRRKAIESGVLARRVVAIRNVLTVKSVQVDISPAEARKKLCAELQIPESDLLIGMVARLNPQKGQRELLWALAPLLAEPELRYHLILAGGENDPGGTYVQEIFRFAREKGILHRLHWLGRRSDVPALLCAFDVFAHPSFNEPCGLAVLEALIAGVPTVVWKEGGAAELVVDGQTGFTVETGDIAALNSALCRLCGDASLRETMRKNALADVARLTDTDSAARQFYAVLADAARLQ